MIGVALARDCQPEVRTYPARRAALRDAAGTCLGAVFVIRDVTFELKLQEDLKRSARLQPIGVLAGSIAHDFNNLLAAIVGNLALARNPSTLAEQALACLADLGWEPSRRAEALDLAELLALVQRGPKSPADCQGS